MARPRTPTANLKLHGSYREDRHGDRREEPTPGGDLVMPRGMSRKVKAAWKMWAKRLGQVTTDWDSESLLALARWWVQYTEIMDYLESQPVLPGYALQQQAAMAWKQCQPLMSKFGMTPSDRAALQRKPQPAKGDDEWEALLA